MKKLEMLKLHIFKGDKSQRDISLDARIPEIRLSRIIRGQALATQEERAALSRVLDVPEEILFQDNQQQSPVTTNR